MVLTDEKHLEPDIWPKAANQAKSMEDIIRRVWATKTQYWQKAKKTHFILSFPSRKEAKNMSQLIFYHMTIMLVIDTKFNHELESSYNRKNSLFNRSSLSIG